MRLPVQPARTTSSFHLQLLAALHNAHPWGASAPTHPTRSPPHPASLGRPGQLHDPRRAPAYSTPTPSLTVHITTKPAKTSQPTQNIWLGNTCFPPRAAQVSYRPRGKLRMRPLLLPLGPIQQPSLHCLPRKKLRWPWSASNPSQRLSTNTWSREDKRFPTSLCEIDVQNEQKQ